MSLFSNRRMNWQGFVAVFAACVALATGSRNLNAQCADYQITQSTGNIEPGTTDIGNHGDDILTTITLPFTWNFYGTNYTTAVACSNGNLQFVAAGNNAWTNTCPLPSATLGFPCMMIYWDDQMTSNAGPTHGIFTSVSGAAPNRIFNIEWRNQYYNVGVPTGDNNYEIRLYEGSTRFDYVYGTTTAGGNGGTIGCQQAGAAGSTNTQFACSTSTNNFPAAGTLLTFDCGMGACCFVDGTCQAISRGTCSAQQGLYAGDGTTCGATCQRPGACCQQNGTCLLTSSAICAGGGGAYAGDGVTCTTANCPPGGACCNDSGNCLVLTSDICASNRGLYHGDNTACSASACIGRCCATDGTCQVISEQACGAISGAIYTAGLTSCNAGYAISTISLDFTDITQPQPPDNLPGAPVAGAAGTDDGTSTAAVPLGFTFNFYGTPQTQVFVNANGFLTFTNSVGVSYQNDLPPTAAVPNNAIYGLWDDLYSVTAVPSPANSILSKTVGSAPSRVFIVQWTGVPQYNAHGDNNTFEIKLFEGTDRIEYHYQTVATIEYEDITGAAGTTVGVENAAGDTATIFDTPATLRATLNGGGTALRLAVLTPCTSTQCACTGDMDNSGTVDGDDLQLYVTDAINNGGSPCGITAISVSAFVAKELTAGANCP